MTEIKEVPIGDIRPYERNPRRNDASVQAVANSIKEFGFRAPIIVDGDGIIIAGHTRYKAAKKLGLKRVPVIYARDMTPAQVEAYRIADNSAGSASEWDLDLLTDILPEISYDMADFGLDLGLVSTYEDAGTEITEDEPPEPDFEREARVKRGEVWQLGDHRLMCGDSTNAKDMATLMDGTKADIAFTSPPYNAHHLDVRKSDARGGGFQKETQKKYLADDDNRTDEEYQQFLETNVNLLMENAEEVFYNIGVGAGSKKTIARLLNTFADRFKDLLYWRKTNPMPVIAEGVISSAVELIIAFGLNGTRSFRHFDDKLFHRVVEGLSASTTNEYADIHKATFPVYLPSEIITRFTRGGERCWTASEGRGQP